MSSRYASPPQHALAYMHVVMGGGKKKRLGTAKRQAMKKKKVQFQNYVASDNDDDSDADAAAADAADAADGADGADPKFAPCWYHSVSKAKHLFPQYQNIKRATKEGHGAGLYREAVKIHCDGYKTVGFKAPAHFKCG